MADLGTIVQQSNQLGNKGRIPCLSHRGRGGSSDGWIRIVSEPGERVVARRHAKLRQTQRGVDAQPMVLRGQQSLQRSRVIDDLESSQSANRRLYHRRIGI